ncbi:MAG: HPF/RaiA family ribosome-associated protein [Lysobacterales bacterium]|jgi:ribosomal subunit interface protein
MPAQPIQIVFHNLEPSPAIEAAIRERAEKLDRYCDGIMSCRVVVESPHKHQRHGKLYTVRIDVTVPNEELVVTRDPGEDHAHEDVYVSIRDAFDAMRRRLEDYARQRRGQVKRHSMPQPGFTPEQK